MRKLKLIMIALLMSVSMFSQELIIEEDVVVADYAWEPNDNYDYSLEELISEYDLIVFKGDVAAFRFSTSAIPIEKDLCIVFLGQLSGSLRVSADLDLYNVEILFNLESEGYAFAGSSNLNFDNIPVSFGQTQDCNGNDISVRNIYSPIIFETAGEFEEFVYNSGEVIFHNTVTLNFSGGVNLETNNNYELPCVNFKDQLLLPQGDVFFNVLALEDVSFNFNLSEDEAIEGYEFSFLGSVLERFNQNVSCSGVWLGNGLGVVNFLYDIEENELFIKIANETDVVEYKVIIKNADGSEIGSTTFSATGASIGQYGNYTLPLSFPDCPSASYTAELYEMKTGNQDFNLIKEITINL